MNIRMPIRRTYRNDLFLRDDKTQYDSPFSLMKKQFNKIFSIRNSDNEFIFDLNQSVKTIKLKLKKYFENN